jgi:hypothetical protein
MVDAAKFAVPVQNAQSFSGSTNGDVGFANDVEASNKITIARRSGQFVTCVPGAMPAEITRFSSPSW